MSASEQTSGINFHSAAPILRLRSLEAK